jgi:hypothetical protein
VLFPLPVEGMLTPQTCAMVQGKTCRGCWLCVLCKRLSWVHNAPQRGPPLICFMAHRELGQGSTDYLLFGQPT